MSAAGCSVTAEGRDDAASLNASCEGYCGGEAPSGCFCDAECAEQGDCCPDIDSVCTLLAACDEESDGDHSDPDRACFLGEDRSGNTCFATVAIDAYSYPNSGSANYRSPIRYLDVENLDLSTKLSPNFKFSEISVPYKGRYQVVQPHAIEKVQAVRDQAGSLTVKSGFRSPPYNSMQPGAATRSRHMYGDAFDLVPGSTSQNNLYNICNSLGAGYTAKYTSGHVHCDWRNVSVDSLFYGSPALGDERPQYFGVEDLEVDVIDEGGVLSVVASGYDTEEGELTREWTAFDAEGFELVRHEDMTFVPPSGTSTVIVDIGGLVEVEHEV